LANDVVNEKILGKISRLISSDDSKNAGRRRKSNQSLKVSTAAADEFFGLYSIIKVQEMVFDGEPSIGMHPPAKVSIICNLDL